MSKVVGGMTVSLDGYVNDRDGSVERLYPDLDALRQSESLQELIERTGAAVMGRHTYDMAEGDLTGYEFQVPIFVLTHRPPEVPARGTNERLSLTFVTEGIERAVEQAIGAAGDRDVVIVGGADVTQQCLRAGLLDELSIYIRPVLLGDGLRLFEQHGTAPVEMEIAEVSESAGSVYVRFRMLPKEN